MVMTEVLGISDSCNRPPPQPSHCPGLDPQLPLELCPIVEMDDVCIKCSLDPAGGPGELSIVLPNGTIITEGTYVLPDIMCSHADVYTCRAMNNPDNCIPSSVTVMIPVFG